MEPLNKNLNNATGNMSPYIETTVLIFTKNSDLSSHKGPPKLNQAPPPFSEKSQKESVIWGDCPIGLSQGWPRQLNNFLFRKHIYFPCVLKKMTFIKEESNSSSIKHQTETKIRKIPFCIIVEYQIKLLSRRVEFLNWTKGENIKEYKERKKVRLKQS